MSLSWRKQSQKIHLYILWWDLTCQGQVYWWKGERTLMEAPVGFTPSCKYLPCGTGDPLQQAKDISVQEKASPKICPHQHRWFNSMQGGSNSSRSSEISLPSPGKIWLSYSPERLLQAVQHCTIAGHEGKNISLQKQILLLLCVGFYSTNEEHARKVLATLWYSLSTVCF